MLLPYTTSPHPKQVTLLAPPHPPTSDVLTHLTLTSNIVSPPTFSTSQQVMLLSYTTSPHPQQVALLAHPTPNKWHC